MSGPQTGYSAYNGFANDVTKIPKEQKSLNNPKSSFQTSSQERSQNERSERTNLTPHEDHNGILKIGSQYYNVPKKFDQFNPKSKQIQTWLREQGMTIVIYGKRGTGKTTILKHFIHENKKLFDKIYLFSSTADLQPKSYNFVPDANKYKGFEEDKIQKIWDEQEKDVVHKKENKKDKAIKHIFLIFDDVIHEARIRHSAIFNSLFTRGRHIRVTVAVLTQSISGQDGLPKVVRDNADLILSFLPENQYDRELMIERYLSIHHKRVGDIILKQITLEPFQAIAILSKEPNKRKYEDYVFEYKNPYKSVDEIPDFMIGSKLEIAPTESTINIGYNAYDRFKIPIMIQDSGSLIRF